MKIVQIGKIGKRIFKEGDILEVKTKRTFFIGKFVGFKRNLFSRKASIVLQTTDFDMADEDEFYIGFKNIRVINIISKEEVIENK